MSCSVATAIEQSQKSKVVDPLKLARAFDGESVPSELQGKGGEVSESQFRDYLVSVWSQAMEDCEG